MRTAGIRIQASRIVDEPAARVFEFLADLRNHWRLDNRFVEVGTLENAEHEPTGGRILLAGPLGLSREARARVLAADPPDAQGRARLAGEAKLGRKTLGRVGWELRHAAPGETRVRLWAEVERASLADRLVLAFGGRWWLRRLFSAALAKLASAPLP